MAAKHSLDSCNWDDPKGEIARQRLLKEAGRGRGVNASVQQDYRMEDIDDCAKIKEASEVMKRGAWRTEAGNKVYREDAEGQNKRYMFMSTGTIDL